MTALIRYRLAAVASSQRYAPPVLLFLAVVAVLDAATTPTLMSRYVACALAQFVALPWLTVVVVNAEDPVQRAVTAVAAGGLRRVLAADVATVGVAHLGLSLAGVLYPLRAGNASPSVVAVGLVGQLIAGTAGIAVGLVCSRLVIPRPGFAALVAVTLVVLGLALPVSPVHRLLNVLSRTADTQAVAAAGSLALYAVVAALELLAAVAVADRVSRRRPD